MSLEHMLDETRAFQHDYKNILSMMAGFIRENQMEELREFFYERIALPMGDQSEQKVAWKYLKNIAPLELKGFLYEKLLSMMACGLRLQIQIAKNVQVEYGDMEALIRILGIFIDNAVEEASRREDGEVGVTITNTPNGVLFCVENNYVDRPELSKMMVKGYSTKGENRGFGLYWAEKVFREHEGMVHELEVTEEKVIQRVEVFQEIICE